MLVIISKIEISYDILVLFNGKHRMYTPPHFKEVRESKILNIIENFPLATVVCNNESELIINHIPLIRLSPKIYLGHIAKANLFHSTFPNGVDAIAVFSSDNSYVSPNWYPSKKLTHRHVPTWNYQVVHLEGRINFDYSHKSKLRVVGMLTKLYEGKHSDNVGWKMSDAPKDYLALMLDNIVAFEFDVRNIIAKSKLSQNRAKEDFNSVKTMMSKLNKSYLLEAMEDIEDVD